MPDADKVAELIEMQMRKSETVQQIIAGAEMVTAGGVEGIQQAAETNPDLILTVINLLSTMVKTQHEMDTVTLTRELDLYDKLDKIAKQ